jgi:glucosamine--fructose-6-phosphate aminotransferase (isomerizing)
LTNCQLAAYIGNRPIASTLLKALELQEPYFGAHATGLAVIDNGKLRYEKDYGHVAHVKEKTDIEKLTGTIGIGHSRYNVNAKNDVQYNTREMAHPFIDESGKIALMHNGGIANYKSHWEHLKQKHKFKSYNPEVDAITDSEVAVHMLSDALTEGKTVPEALKWMASEYTGAFLLGVLQENRPETIWIANWYQPCYVAIGDDEVMFVSSKIGLGSLGEDIDRIFQPPKNSLITLTRGNAKISTLDKKRKIPDLHLNVNKLSQLILEKLEEKEELDFREISDILNPSGWAESYGVTPEEWTALRKNGISIVNSYIDVLNLLINEGKIKQTIDERWEGGVNDTPRFSYRLV